MALRLRKRWGAVRLAAECGVAASTAGAVLRRCGVSRLSRLDRRAQTVNRYEHAAPGELLHADVKKLGNIPAGGGWRFRGRQAGKANRHLDGGRARNRHHNPLMGHGFIHVVLDDHSRVAYAPAGLRRDLLGRDRPDRRRRAAARRGLVRRPRGDRPPRAHRQRRLLPQPRLGRAWAACAQLGLTPKRTRPYRPQTNGKVERFNRTMTSEWAFAQLFTSEADRRAAFPAWLHTYNHHRPHTGIGGHPPISRLTNLPGQYS